MLCSKSSSVWNANLNDCLYCPTGWIDWENNHCLSLAMVAEGGLTYGQASDTCQSFSAQLFYLHNIQEFQQFELKIQTLFHSTVSNAVTMFFRLGAWIDKLNIQRSEDIWCKDSQMDPAHACVYIKRLNPESDSLCLSRLKLPAISEKDTITNGNSDSSDQRFVQLLTALAPVALEVLNGLFGTQAQPTAPPQPQQIIIQQDPSLSAHAAGSDNTMLYFVFGIGGFVLLLFMCGIAIAVIYFTGCLNNSSSNRRNNERSSVDSTLSYA